MSLDSLVDWGSTCIDVVLALALIAIGAAVVRPARPTAAWLVIAAGVVQLLTSCCFKAADQLWDRVGGDVAQTASLVMRGIALVSIVAYLAPLIAAAWTLAPRDGEKTAADLDRPPT